MIYIYGQNKPFLLKYMNDEERDIYIQTQNVYMQIHETLPGCDLQHFQEYLLQPKQQSWGSSETRKRPCWIFHEPTVPKIKHMLVRLQYLFIFPFNSCAYQVAYSWPFPIMTPPLTMSPTRTLAVLLLEPPAISCFCSWQLNK